MALIAAFLLRLIHFIYSVAIVLRSFWKRQFTNVPLSLDAPRSRIPKHLALLFVVDSNSNTELTENALVESVASAVEWCRVLGIKKLTVYEETGLVTSCSQRIYDAIPSQPEECSSESEIDYPLTPPPSDYSESRSLSPLHREGALVPAVVVHIPASPAKSARRSVVRKTKRKSSASCYTRKPFSLCLISREASKAAIASAARYLIQIHQASDSSVGNKHPFRLSINELNLLLENEDALSSPDFMIIHAINPMQNSTAGELHGFPPWHIRLTELYYTNSYSKSNYLQRCLPGKHRKGLPAVPLNETTFREALDDFATAEMRFGK